MSRVLWTAEEDAVLVANWGTEAPVAMWAPEGRSVAAIHKRALKLRLGGRNIRMQLLYPHVYERAESILDLLRNGPLSTPKIRAALDLNKTTHRRAHDKIRRQIYIFAWEETATGAPIPVWALGDAPDAKRPPKVPTEVSQAKYREKQRKRRKSPIKPAHRMADLAASWMFNPC